MRFLIYKFLKQPGRLLIVTSLLFIAPGAYADSYLSELEAEASSTGVQAQDYSSTSWSHKKQGLTDAFSSGMTHPEFEDTLRDNYYGSFIFYEKLSKWNKKKVFKTYQTTNDIEQIRNEIKTRMTK